ncbi:MAG: hypothetical protein PHC61_15660 [Chitinivibrionales bacterium]|nr:hypothetical protein [Chitinivibrionales bacterium]
MDKKAFKLLLRSPDAPLNEDEERCLATALRQSTEMQAQRDALTDLRASIGALGTVTFGPYFSDRVMAAIQSRAPNGPALSFATFLAAFRPVVLASALVIAVLASFNIYYSSTNNRKEGIDNVLSMIEDAHALLLEEQLCAQK